MLGIGDERYGGLRRVLDGGMESNLNDRNLRRPGVVVFEQTSGKERGISLAEEAADAKQIMR